VNGAPHAAGAKANVGANAGTGAVRLAVDRHALQRAFSRASTHYDAAATLQAEVRAELHERLGFFTLAPRRILDAGCGTGEGTRALRRRFRGARVLGLDLAPGMLRTARARTGPWPWPWPWRRLPLVCADVQSLPLPDASLDLVVSNLMLQWCDDLPRAFTQLRRALRPGGLLLFSTFGSETLLELRAAWADADESAHVSPFVDMPSLGAALAGAGFSEPVLDRELRVQQHATVRALMDSIRAIGAGNALATRRRTLTGTGRLRRMQAAYEAQRTDAGLPATWEVLYGAAFAGSGDHGRFANGAAGGPPGEAQVPLAALRPARRRQD